MDTSVVPEMWWRQIAKAWSLENCKPGTSSTIILFKMCLLRKQTVEWVGNLGTLVERNSSGNGVVVEILYAGT